MAYAALGSLVRLVLHIYATGYYVAHVSNIGFYDQMEDAWQLTIWSMHVAPIVAARLLLREHYGSSSTTWLLELVIGAAWLIVSLRLRRWKVHVWSLSFCAIEFAVAASPLELLPLGGLLALQVGIIVGFWLGIFAAAQSDTLSFLPLDRHLHRGLRHMLTSHEAKARLVHDMGGHGVQQLLFMLGLHHAGISPSASSCLAIGLSYAVVVLVVAWSVPPHRVPYVHKSLRRRARTEDPR